MGRRSGHTSAQKRDAVLAVLTKRKTISEVCRELAVSEQTFHRWRNQALEGMETALGDKADTNAREAELASLLLQGAVEPFDERVAVRMPIRGAARRDAELAAILEEPGRSELAAVAGSSAGTTTSTATPASRSTPPPTCTTGEPPRSASSVASSSTPPTPNTPNASSASIPNRRARPPPCGSTSRRRTPLRHSDSRRNLPQEGLTRAGLRKVDTRRIDQHPRHPPSASDAAAQTSSPTPSRLPS